jgi:hypothetical protein
MIMYGSWQLLPPEADLVGHPCYIASMIGEKWMMITRRRTNINALIGIQTHGLRVQVIKANTSDRADIESDRVHYAGANDWTMMMWQKSGRGNVD